MPGNIGDFKELVENSKGLFVDKSLFIQEIIDSKTDPFLITRPRRGGKTINMSMLFYFFVHAKQLEGMGKGKEFIESCNTIFQDLGILKANLKLELAKTYMRQYPVIFTSFALSGDDASKDDITTPDWAKIKGLIIDRIAKLFSDFNYIAEGLKKKSNEKFNEELSKRILEYKNQFSLEDISEQERLNIYKENRQNQSTYPEQRDLEKFYRLRKGEPKNDAELYQSINFLAQLLHKFHNKSVFIFIDEYDSLINKYFNQPNILDELTKTFSGIFSAFAKPTEMINDYIQKVIFTGILRVAKANIFSGLNNLREFTILDPEFDKYYGFTEEEVNALLEKAKITDRKGIKDWYNGYFVGQNTIYNPWSIMMCIAKNGKLEPYWVDTANREIIKDIVLNNKGHAINKLLRNIIKNGIDGTTVSIDARKSVSVEDLQNPDSIWSFLIHTGYLTAIKSKSDLEVTGMLKCDVKIPNAEVETIYNSIIREWLTKHAVVSGMIATLFEQDYQGFVDNLQRMLEQKYDSAIFARESNSVEEVYHSLLLAALNKDTTMIRYSLLPEEYTGEGRVDILLVDNEKKTIVSIELKRTSSGTKAALTKGAEEAVEQTIRERYGDDEKYKTYKKLPAVGVNFHGTDIALKVEGKDDIILRRKSKSGLASAEQPVSKKTKVVLEREKQLTNDDSTDQSQLHQQELFFSSQQIAHHSAEEQSKLDPVLEAMSKFESSPQPRPT